MKPLEGLVVLDLTRFLAGPYCTLLLGGLGANVIKIEPPQGGEAHRNRAPFGGPNGASMSRQTEDDIGLMVLHRARNKKSITLNLRDPQGTTLFKQLVKKADVVVENFSPGTIDKMGLDYETLRACNPRIILCSISGFGQHGPRRDWRAYDPIIQAASGINSVTGRRSIREKRFEPKAPKNTMNRLAIRRRTNICVTRSGCSENSRTPGMTL